MVEHLVPDTVINPEMRMGNKDRSEETSLVMHVCGTRQAVDVGKEFLVPLSQGCFALIIELIRCVTQLCQKPNVLEN